MSRLLIAALFVLPVFAPRAAAQPAASSVDLDAFARSAQCSLARNGHEVLVAWTLPAVPIKGLDIYRNTHEQTRGRTRIDFVRALPPTFIDRVPDLGADYWYWLKIVLTDGRIVNVGPLRTPRGDVWTP